MKYRTKDGQDYTLPGIGRTTNGIIVTDKIIENANFEPIEETPQPSAAPQSPQPVASQPQPAVPASAPAQVVQQTNQEGNI